MDRNRRVANGGRGEALGAKPPPVAGSAPDENYAVYCKV